MKDTKGKVLENLPISPRTYMMQVLAPQIAPYVRAGHFVMIKVSHTKDPIGRRAFAVADIKEDSLFIFYDVVGRGTELLSS
ncbi:MAG: dihydroorotate dehydrogenase electron transfer subunit, partial [Hydrogenobacter sp.]